VFNRWSGYDAVTDRVRVALLQLYAGDGRAPAIAALAERAGLSEPAIRPVLEELRRRDLVVLDCGRIIGAYPYTDRDTGHRVTLGRTQVKTHVNAMCGLDALGIGAMTGGDVRVASRCRHCGAAVRIATRDRGTALADIAATTAFFCSDDHLAAWRRECSADEPGFRLSIPEALEAGRALFGPSLAGLDAAPQRPADRPGRANGAKLRNGNGCDLVVLGAGSASRPARLGP